MGAMPCITGSMVAKLSLYRNKDVISKDINNPNLVLLNILLISIGIFLFILNSIGSLKTPNVFLLSIILMLSPTLWGIYNVRFFEENKISSFIYAIIPIIFVNYIVFAKMSAPVGYNDVYQHIFWYEQLVSQKDNILFSMGQMPSNNFVGLYLIIDFISEISKWDIMVLASIIPPFFNIVLILSVFIFLRRVYSHEVALISMIFYGFEITVLNFGRELRTQTLGTIFLLILFYVILFYYDFNNPRSPPKSIVSLIMILAISITSFVSFFYMNLMLIAILVVAISTHYLLNWTKNSNNDDIYLVYIAISVTSFMFYMLYVGVSLENILIVLRQLYDRMILSDADTLTTITPIQMIPIYGFFVKFVDRLFWLISIISALFYIKYILDKRELHHIFFFSSFSMMLLLSFFSAFVGPLSYTRSYVIGFILLSFLVAFLISYLLELENKIFMKKLIRLFIILFVIVIVSTSLAKHPKYIVGDTGPIRSSEPIDTIHYWDIDLPQYGLADFIYNYTLNQNIYVYMHILNYQFISSANVNDDKLIIESNKLPYDIQPRVNDLLILHNKFNNGYYTYREYLLPSKFFDNCSNIFTNDDYKIYNEGTS